MELRENVKKTLRTDENKLRIAKAANRSVSTIERWISSDSHLLQLKGVLEEMEQITGLTEDELFTKDKSKDVEPQVSHE